MILVLSGTSIFIHRRSQWWDLGKQDGVAARGEKGSWLGAHKQGLWNVEWQKKRQGGGRTKYLSKSTWRELLYEDLWAEWCILVTTPFRGSHTHAHLHLTPPLFSSRFVVVQTVFEHRPRTSTAPLAEGLGGSDSNVWAGKWTRRQWDRQYAWNIQILQPKQNHLFYRGNIDLNCNLIGS